MSVLWLWPHLHKLPLSALSYNMNEECGADLVLRAMAPGIHRNEAWGTGLEAEGTEQLEMATKFCSDHFSWGLRPIRSYVALHLSFQLQAGKVVLALECPDESLLGASGKGASVPVAPAAQSWVVVAADFIAPRSWEAGPAAYLTPHPILGTLLVSNQQDLPGAVVFHFMQDVGALIEALGALGAAQVKVYLSIEFCPGWPCGGWHAGRPQTAPQRCRLR